MSSHHASAIEVRDIVARKGALSVLAGVSFDVPENGMVVTVLGRSGAGKTTLLRILAGLDRPEGGVTLANGEVLSRRDVGIVFQDYPLLEHRTVRDNLRVAGADDDRAHELLARLSLDSVTDRWPSELSGGQRQRVAIAQQLARPRRLLLLDEPFSGLDPVAVDEVSALVRETAEGRVVLLVTHDVHAALEVGDAVLVLANGRVARADGEDHAAIKARLAREEP